MTTWTVRHVAPNRAQRRANGHRDPKTKKLIFDPGLNIVYRKDI